jgi:hypothetical protein
MKTLSITLAIFALCAVVAVKFLDQEAARQRAQAEANSPGVSIALPSDPKLARDTCEKTYPASDTNRAIMRAKCIIEADRLRPNYQHNEYRPLFEATRLALAEKVQTGAITTAEARKLFEEEIIKLRGDSIARQAIISQSFQRSFPSISQSFETSSPRHTTCFGDSEQFDCYGN